MDDSQRPLADVLAVESAVLMELAKDFQDEGRQGDARLIQKTVAVMDSESLSPLDRARQAVLFLRPLSKRLDQTGPAELAKGILRIRRRIAAEADKLLSTTLRLTTGEWKIPDD